MPTRLIVLVTFAAFWVAPLAGAQTTAGATPAPTPPAATPHAGTPQTGAPRAGTPQTGTPQAGAAQAGVPQPGTAAAPAAAPPASAATSPQQAGAVALPADYRLTIGDKLRVEVYKDTQLSQSLQVRPDGKITLPLIGDMNAAGLTSIELRDRIATALKEYVTNPVVTVIVVETVPPVVYVMGEVANPGAVPLNGSMSVLQALAMAGGFRDFADTKDIRVLRRSPRGLQTLSFNYKAAVKGDGDPVLLQAGDTVIVP
jgi:polysaccharide export outer membrane protein